MNTLVSELIIDNIKEHPTKKMFQIITFKDCDYQVIERNEFKVYSIVYFFREHAVIPKCLFHLHPSLANKKHKDHVVKAYAIDEIKNDGLIFDKSLFPKDFDISSIKKLDLNDPEYHTDAKEINLKPFPTDKVSKTGEENYASKSGRKCLDLMKDKPYFISEKIDGTSATYGFFDNALVVCSRNNIILEAKEGDRYHAIAKKYNLQQVLSANPTIIIQGEIYGPKIGKNLTEETELKFAVFNVCENGKKLNLQDSVSFCKKNGLEFVTILEEGDCFNLTSKDLVAKAKGNHTGTDKLREGIVLRTQDNTLSLKIKNW